MRFWSLRWKLTLALVTFSFISMAIYVVIATGTFESSMIAYAFDSEQSKVTKVSEDFDREVTNLLFLASSTISNYDFAHRRLDPLGQKLFWSQASLLAIELVDGTRDQTLLKVEKKSGDLPKAEASEAKLRAEDSVVLPVAFDRVLLVAGQSGDGGDVLRLRVLIRMPNLFPGDADRSYFVGSPRGVIVAKGNVFGAEDVADVNADLARARSATTIIRPVAGRAALVSSSHAKSADFAFFSVTPVDVALRGLRTLYHQSIAFCLLTAFVVVILSLLLSRRMTRQLQAITLAAEEVGRGDFARPPRVSSNDEIGVLSAAFVAMSTEIRRLLVATEDKARMEQDLNTARLVQGSLMPKAPTFAVGDISVASFYVTSTECGGDWWHHFSRGDDLYVCIADATGHGTGAALITAAARSAFALIERADYSLHDMMSAWDAAIRACSNESVFMTGLLIRVNVRTGRGVILNASHELPLLYRHARAGGLNAEHLSLTAGPMLGEGGRTWTEHPLDLNPGDRLILYTDGLTALTNVQGRTLNERQINRLVIEEGAADESVAHVRDRLLARVDAHRGDRALPDDVMAVVIGRSA